VKYRVENYRYLNKRLTVWLLNMLKKTVLSL
jgi:hypothetical protein